MSKRDPSNGAAAKAKDQMKRSLLLNVVIRESSAVLELLSGEDETLLVRGDPLFVLNLLLHVLDRIRWLDIQCNGLPRKGLYKNLHLVKNIFFLLFYRLVNLCSRYIVVFDKKTVRERKVLETVVLWRGNDHDNFVLVSLETSVGVRLEGSQQGFTVADDQSEDLIAIDRRVDLRQAQTCVDGLRLVNFAIIQLLYSLGKIGNVGDGQKRPFRHRQSASKFVVRNGHHNIPEF